MFYLLSVLLVIAVADPDCTDIESRVVKRGQDIIISTHYSTKSNYVFFTVKKDTTQKSIAQSTCRNEDICNSDTMKVSRKSEFLACCDSNRVTLIKLNASYRDTGIYMFNRFGNSLPTNETLMCVKITVVDDDDQLPGSIFREPPFIHPSTAPALFSAGSRETLEAYTTSSWTEGKETARTDSLSSLKQSGTFAGVIVGGIFGSLSVVAAVIGVIYYICKKKKQKNPGAGDPDEIIPLSSNINGAGKPDTGESSKMVDEANSSVDFVVQVLL